MGPPVTSRDVGVYVHFPYCEKKCPYCDFNSHVLFHDDDRTADAIQRELEDRAQGYLRGRSFSTLYFGGGTPSLWSPKAVGRVIDCVRGLGLSPSAEITLEANPGTVHERSFEDFARAGVNRFSIGTQSFLPRELIQLGRIHDATAGERAVRLAKATGARVSLDLIYGQPGQSRDDVTRSIERALSLEPHHISAYTLTIEPGTALFRQAETGSFSPMGEDDQADLIEHVTRTLEGAGFWRYEVSSYAPAGFEARHNTLYWLGGDYLGVGAGAHSYRVAPGLRVAERRSNRKSPVEYEARALAWDHTPASREHLLLPLVVAERLMLGVRVKWGVDIDALAQEAEDPALPGKLEAILAPMIAGGLLLRNGPRVAPTPRGFLFADELGRKLLDVQELLTAPALAEQDPTWLQWKAEWPDPS